jgi:hypothetical protein
LWAQAAFSSLDLLAAQATAVGQGFLTGWDIPDPRAVFVWAVAKVLAFNEEAITVCIALERERRHAKNSRGLPSGHPLSNMCHG